MIVTLEQLRRKRVDGTPLAWDAYSAYGWVTRVARNGAWADMIWAHCCPPTLNGPPDWATQWRKRQPLDRLADWRDA